MLEVLANDATATDGPSFSPRAMPLRLASLSLLGSKPFWVKPIRSNCAKSALSAGLMSVDCSAKASCFKNPNSSVTTPWTFARSAISLPFWKRAAFRAPLAASK